MCKIVCSEHLFCARQYVMGWNYIGDVRGWLSAEKREVMVRQSWKIGWD